MNAQATLRSIVLDSNKNTVLEGATVSLLHLPDSAMIRQARSTKTGFVFRNVLPGNYCIKTSFIGYNSSNFYFRLFLGDSLRVLPPVKLSPGASVMVEVIVKASIPPVISKSDTLVYNASSFKTRANASVEDLLRKLPGVAVDAKGQVTVNGQKVEKFYIDGKEIPVGDPRSLTQNLTAGMLQSIEAYDRQSDNSRFSGARDNNQAKALNFKVKKEFERSVSGRAFASCGTQDYYGYGANGFLLLPSSKWQLNFARNNSNGMMGAEGVHGFGNPPGITASTSAELRGTTEFSRGFTLMGEYVFNHSNGHNENTGMRQTFLADSSLLNNNASHSNNLNTTHSANASVHYKLDSMSEITAFSSVNFNHTIIGSGGSQSVRVEKSIMQYESTTASTNSQENTTTNGVASSIAFRHRFHKKGETIMIQISYTSQDNHSDKKFYSHTQVSDSAGSAVLDTALQQLSSQSSPAHNLNTGLTFTYPIKAGLIADANYSYNKQYLYSNKSTYNYDSSSGQYDKLDFLSTNQFANNLEIHNFNAGINGLGKSFRYQAGLGMQYNHQYNHNYSGPGIDLTQRFLNWFPRAGFFYSLSKWQQIDCNYSGGSQAPAIDQLAPLPDLSNPLLVRKGNPSLKPEFDHYFLMHYTIFSKDRMQSLMVGAKFNLSDGKLTPSTTLLPGGIQQVQYVNLDGSWSGSINATYNFPFSKGRKGNAKIGSILSYNAEPSLVNGKLAQQKSLHLIPTLSVNYSPAGRLLVETEINLNLTGTYYGYSQSRSQQFNQRYNLSVSYDLPFAMYLQTDLMANAVASQANLPGQTTFLWNANLTKQLLKKKTLELRICAFDILKSNKGFSQSAGDNFIATSNNLVMTRTFFVSIVYHFLHKIK